MGKGDTIMPSLTALREWIPWRAREAAGAAALVVDAHPHCAPAGATALDILGRRWSHLLMRDNSHAAFIDWAGTNRIDISDPISADLNYREQCRFQKLKALRIDWDAPVVLPAIPAPVAEAIPVEAAPLDVEIEDVAPVKPFRPKLDAERAAHAFVEWCRNEGRCGTYSSKQITSLYREHCAAEDFVAVADNMLKKHLATIPGVIKDQDETHTSASEGHRRHRPTRWIIKADATPDNVIDMIFPALPERQKAA